MSRALIELPPIIWRAADAWREARECNEPAANRGRIEAYRQRLVASADPYADPALVERRQVAGLKVLAELRKRSRRLRLKRRLTVVPAPSDATPAPTDSGNVVAIPRRGRK